MAAAVTTTSNVDKLVNSASAVVAGVLTLMSLTTPAACVALVPAAVQIVEGIIEVLGTDHPSAAELQTLLNQLLALPDLPEVVQ